MEKYIISNIEKNALYYLNGKDNHYEVVFEFHSDVRPQLEDKIIINGSILDFNSEKFSQPFCYSLVGENNPIMKKYIDSNADEYLILVQNEKEFLFKRIYG